MRDTFVRTLVELAKQDKNIELITGDLGFGVLKPYYEAVPDQFTNAGITTLYSFAEQFINSFDVQNLLEKKTADSLEVRITQWKSIITVMLNSGLKNLLLGYGLDYPKIVGSVSSYYISAHNIFFGHLIQNGVIGLICIFSLFFNSIKKSIQIFKTDDVKGKFIAALVVAMWIAYQFVSMVRWEFWFSIIVLELYYSSHIMQVNNDM